MTQRPVIDVHGMTREEAVRTIRANLLAFYDMGFPEVHIIHGKGQGILRDTVRDLLRATTFVRKARSGRPNEGGSGVTVAVFS
ncbi:TPA: Smr/MutS family protein [Candidatus Woesearchaeota archaeon]|nr:MutS2 protein [archaeon GW2011_AR15]MBS3103967.1 Smr/MutS family protein [Candidatus Woesearchaeota archaeon]HIH40965.1 Smr/MutS family protein [Candidatus Woesearchaeota archaeon]